MPEKNDQVKTKLSQTANVGMISRINGPVVEVTGMSDAGMLEVVEVGELRLIGEVIRLQGKRATVQVYEDTSGVRPGEPVFGTGRPLSVLLGPGMVGNIYDGIQRPLEAIAKETGHFIGRGQKPSGLDLAKKWAFKPCVGPNDAVTENTVIGTVVESLSVTLKILAPPGVSGRVKHILPEGEYTVEEVVCVVSGPGGESDVKLANYWPVRKPRPCAGRKQLDMPFVTGLRVIDTFFPIAQGGTAAIPGGFGTGKTMTQHALAKWSSADVIVYIGCGERGNEMTEVLHEFPELIDPRSGRSLMERTILIANTSNMPVAAREVSIYTGVTIAEYYRDMGYNVAVMADSTSRWAEALRELSGRLEEMPADEGFPAYLPSRLAEFYERAGRVETLSGDEGTVSIIGAVSPPGGDFSEPVTQHTSRFIRCFWALNRELANARHYPAIGWLESYSEYIPEVETWWGNLEPDWRDLRERLMRVLQDEVKLQRIAKLVGPDALPDDQRLILFVAELIKNGYLQQNSFDEVDVYCSPGKQLLMMKLLLRFQERAIKVLEVGGTLAAIRELPCLERMVRVKSTISNEEIDQFDDLFDRLNKEFDELERRLG